MGIERKALVRSCPIDIAPQQGRTRIAHPYYEGRLQFIEGLSPMLLSEKATDLWKTGRLWSS
jgi:hypothetical protein